MKPKKESKPANVELGKRVQRQRLKVDITREKLAERAGISARFVADIEVGNVGMSIATLKSLCRILEISADALLFGEPVGIDALLRDCDPTTVEQIEKLVRLQLEILQKKP